MSDYRVAALDEIGKHHWVVGRTVEPLTSR
jgi:hypothetical protein